MDPAGLGYTERRPGSGIWSRPGRPGSYAPGACEHCGVPFMARRGPSRGRDTGQRFCSVRCGSLARRKPDASYRARHDRVQRARGKASDQVCVGCGGPAQDWSQVHGTDGREPGQYRPRCRRCHAAYDGRSNLTAARVRGIYASAGAAHRELSERHRVSQSTVARIRRGEVWAQVTQPRASSRCPAALPAR